MENGGSVNGKECVRVAVNVRPLITPELLHGCTDCIAITPGEPQVQIGSHSFTFDYVFGNGATPCSRVFDECVAPLIDALFRGYNGTVLAYGQTGSGKTYTMGTNYSGEAKSGGIIPEVMETIFSRVEALKGSTEFLIRVSFIEIFKEEVFDLLDPNPPLATKGEGVGVTKPTGPVRVPIQIRETVNAGITLAGVTEPEVCSKEEMGAFLTRGSAARATASTNMNSQSSRSHAIFTISVEQKKIAQCSAGSHGDNSDDILSAKLHLVDLAGSERAKRTGADGMRLKEGIHINKGLLALGNVISALGDEKKRKEGGHVPYRDSKLTRLLQDSLGGNSKTVMIACVSPADTNAEETLNTLKYANRARNIQNRAVINRDPATAQMQRMRSQIEQLQAELVYYRGDSGVSFDELQILKHKISLLEASNAELQRELQERHVSCEHLSQRAFEAQIEKDKLIMKIEAARSGKPLEEFDSQEIDLIKTYVSKIHELEGELVRLQNMNSIKRGGFSDSCESDDEVVIAKKPYYSGFDELSSIADTKETTGEEVDEKELEHSSLQERLDRELKELDMKLEQKEAEMKRFAGGDTIVLKQHYEKKVLELEHEKKALQKEIEDLRHKLTGIPSTSDEGAKKLKEEYLQKLNLLESQVSDLKKKQEAQAQLLKQKQKSDDAAKRLQDEIQRIKSQKVQLQNKIKQESEQFRMWKASREKEVLQLKKEGRRNEYEMHKLLALNQRQKTVLQRKTEEAAMATKRLKELLEARKTASREASGIGNSHGAGLQALMQGIEHELEVTVRVHEVRSQYERHQEERAKMAQEIARLKEEENLIKQNKMSECSETMSPSARNSRIFALENMLSTSSSSLVSMASHLHEAEERERTFSGRGRWNQVRTLADAKNLMNYLFNIASSSRCMVRDKEIDCSEKDMEIKELKEKVVKLSSVARQLDKKNIELARQVHQQGAAISRLTSQNSGETRMYDLRQGLRSSGLFKHIGNNSLDSEDMDTSDSENNTGDDSTDDEWVHPMFIADKKNAKKGRRSRPGSHLIDTDGRGSAETVTSDKEKSNSGVCCCSCSKKSSCKTQKCECRTSGNGCTESCGCSSSKCSNRNDGQQVKGDDSGQQSPEEVEQGNEDLASRGAALLQSALSEMHGENEVRRKPLSDIGNTAAKSNAPRPAQRKKYSKSVVQLVPATPPATQPENVEPPKRPENSTAEEANIPYKLPRSMRSVASNSNLLRDRNLEQGEESVVRRPNKSDEKENFGH